MTFHSKTEKSVQAAALLLKLEGSKKMNYMRLLKLLYIADRESIKETGRPIIGNCPVAMKWGPLHSEVYDWIKGQGKLKEKSIWAYFIEKIGYFVTLKKDPGETELSRYEIRKLKEIFERYHSQTDFELSDLTHGFQEYEKNYQVGTSTVIPLEDIIDAVGRSEDKENILVEAREKEIFDQVFRN